MLHYAFCAFVLLPKSLLGLILLSSQGSIYPPGNNTSTLNMDDILEDQSYGVPFSNLERQTVPLEWDDITFSKDAIRLKKKNSKRQRRHHEISNSNDNPHNTNSLDTGKHYSDAAVGNILSVAKNSPRDRYKHSGREPFFIPNVRSRPLNSYHHVGISSSSASTTVGTKYTLDDIKLTTTPHRPKKSSRLHFHLHRDPRPSLSSYASIQNSSKISPFSNRGSNTHRQETQPKRDDQSPDITSNTSSMPGHRSWTHLSEIATSRHKRQAPRVTRVKLSQLIEAKPGIGQPIILRKRNRIEAKVGVLVVVENSIYRKYMQDNGNNPKAALARIRRYYGMIFSMMDQRFKTIKDPYLSVSVTISGILVAEAREDSSWLERIVDWSTARSHGRGSVITDRALKKFTKWISGQVDLPEYDHAMVFTAYRLTNKQGASLGGMAYLNAVCDTMSGNAVSIVVDSGDFQSVKVATHELAHSLGAYHDGDRQSKSCRPDSNYVMSPLTSHDNHVLRNAFYFSPCSIRDMSHHLSKQSSSCVRNDPPVYYSYDLQRLPPGLLYSSDMQCKLIFGKKSEYCREGNLVDIMCGQLWCRDPNKDNGCRTNTYLTALPGTKCAPTKVCHLGECITDTSRNSVERQELTSSIHVISRTNKPAQPSFRAQDHKKKDSKHLKQRAHVAKRVKRKRKNQCTEDKNANYCERLIRLNPGGCERRAIRQYCCFTCRQQQRQRPRRIKFD